MANVSNKTILCFDNGTFFSFCLSLSEHYKEVLYYCPWDYSGFPKPDKARVGSEWQNGKMLGTFEGKPFKMVESFFDNLENADVILFTDCYQGDLMEHLRSQGYPVCGSGHGQILELNRWQCKQMFKAQGMDVNPMKRVVGITSLRELLMKEKNKYVKVSKYRRLVESFHHDTYEISCTVLDRMENQMGPMAETIEFIIEDPIDAIVEEGIDIYTVDGKYPNTVLAGTEVKNKSYYGELMKYSELTLGVTKTTNAVSSLMKKYKYKGFFSTEVRTTKDNENYLIDMTCRLPLPPSPLYPLMFDNLGEIIWGIANGELVDIKPRAKCGLYLSITSNNYQADYQTLYFPEKYKENVRLVNGMKVDGLYTALNLNGFPEPEVGCIAVAGNSFEECKKQAEAIAEEVKGFGIIIDTANIDKAKEEFDKMMGKKS
jgi:hypothetical protein